MSWQELFCVCEVVMDGVIVIENFINEDGWRILHVMSNVKINASFPADALIEETIEIGVHHLRVREPMRSMVDVHFEGLPMGFRRLVMWNLHGYSFAKEALFDAAREFERLFGSMPVYGFMKKLPRGVENGQAVGSLDLFEAEWMLSKCVAVGCKSSTPIALRALPPNAALSHLGEEETRS